MTGNDKTDIVVTCQGGEERGSRQFVEVAVVGLCAGAVEDRHGVASGARRATHADRLLVPFIETVAQHEAVAAFHDRLDLARKRRGRGDSMVAKPHCVIEQRHPMDETVILCLRNLLLVGFKRIGIMGCVENQVIYLVICRNT